MALFTLISSREHQMWTHREQAERGWCICVTLTSAATEPVLWGIAAGSTSERPEVTSAHRVRGCRTCDKGVKMAAPMVWYVSRETPQFIPHWIVQHYWLMLCRGRPQRVWNTTVRTEENRKKTGGSGWSNDHSRHDALEQQGSILNNMKFASIKM